MNLRLKLFLPFVIIFGLVCCVSSFYLVPSYIDFLECEQIENENSQLAVLSAALEPEIIESHIGHVSISLSKALNSKEHWHSLALLDKSGKQLYQEIKSKKLSNIELTTVTHSVTSSGQLYGNLTMSFDPNPGIEKQINFAGFLHFAVLIVLTMTFLSVCIFLDRFIRKPMVKLVGFADQIARGNYQTVSNVYAHDEVGQLGKSLEAMRQKINKRDSTMNHYAEIQNTIRFIQSKFISSEDNQHVFMELQSRILTLTKSNGALIGEIQKNEDKVLFLKTLSLKEVCNIHLSTPINDRSLPESTSLPRLETLLGKVMTSGQPVLNNGPKVSNEELGFPASGQQDADNFLGLPLYSGYQLIGVLGLVNKEGGFDLSTYKELEILLQTLAQLIVAMREKKALTDNEARLRLVVDSAVEGIISVNDHGLITDFNSAAERIFGYTADQIKGESVGLLIPPENHFNHLEAVRFLLNADNYPGKPNTEIETDGLHKNGKLVPVELSFSKISMDGKVQYTGVVRDITERKQHESELNRAYAELQEAHELLEQQNRIDPLTGLANRRYLDEALRLEWKRAQRLDKTPLTIMLCDIDYFKKYNDTYGHLEGDDCLTEVAKAMAESFTRKIDIVARYGGEEFMIILPNTSAESAMQQAELMRQRIFDLDIKHKSSQVADRITISIGIYTVEPTVNHKLRKAIQRADEALYDAKANGRNQVSLDDKTQCDLAVEKQAQ